MAISSLSKFTVPVGAQPQGLLMPKLKYRFRVQLIGFGVTNGNAVELTKNVVDIARPTIAFDPITLDVYNSRVFLAGKHTWSPVALNVRDDVTGGVSKIVGEQLQKQFDFLEQASAASGIDYKFTTKVEVLDGSNAGDATGVLETWELYGCYLENVNYNNLSYSENAAVTITMSIKYDNAMMTNKETGFLTQAGKTAGTLGTGAGTNATGAGTV
jgi:hypothetical protein